MKNLMHKIFPFYKNLIDEVEYLKYKIKCLEEIINKLQKRSTAHDARLDYFDKKIYDFENIEDFNFDMVYEYETK